jgi:hypothetical protein
LHRQLPRGGPSAGRETIEKFIDGVLQRRYFCPPNSEKPGIDRDMRTVRFACLLALVAGALLGLAGEAGAQGSPEAQQACTPDAMRLCADVIPDVAKVTSCMLAKRSQLSPECRAAMAAGGKHETRHRRYHHCRHHCGS